MIRRLLFASVALTIACAAVAQERQGAQRTPQRSPQTPSTLRVLNDRIPQLAFQDTPLEQVMDWLSDFTGLNISVRWQMLADAGVERDTPISIKTRNLRLSQVLWLIMNEAGGSDVRLAYRASGTLMILSTEEDLNKEMITKIYDIADLLVVLPRASRENAFDVSQGMGQGGGSGGGGGGGGGGMFGQGSQQQNQGEDLGQESVEAQITKIVDLIEQTVEPDSWRTNGGMGSIIPFQKSLVVRNTILVHQRLGGYVTEDDALGR